MEATYGGSPIHVEFLASCCVAFTSTPATRIVAGGPGSPAHRLRPVCGGPGSPPHRLRPVCGGPGSEKATWQHRFRSTPIGEPLYAASGTAVTLPTRRMLSSKLAEFSCIRAPLSIRCSRRPRSAGRVCARNVSARASISVCYQPALDLASSAAISIGTAEDPRPLWTLHGSAELNDPTGWDPWLRRIRPTIHGPIPRRRAAITESGESFEENFR